MSLQRVVKLLSHAETVPDVVGTVIRDGARLFHGRSFGMELLDATGRPIVCVDIGVAAEGATSYLKGAFREEPLLARVRDSMATIAVSDVMSIERYQAQAVAVLGVDPVRAARFGDHVAAAVVGRGAVVGLLRARPTGPVTPALRADITSLASHVSAQLAHVGLPTPAVRARVESLTMRQRKVLRAFLHGVLEAEIAAHLELPERIVERELRAVFARLGARARDQLGALIGRGDDWIDGYASLDRLDGVNVTRWESGQIVRRAPWPAIE